MRIFKLRKNEYNSLGLNITHKDSATVILLDGCLNNEEGVVYQKYIKYLYWVGDSFSVFVKENPKCRKILLITKDDGFNCDYLFFDYDKLKISQ